MMKPIEKSIYSYFEAFAAECGSRRFLFDETRSYTVQESFQAAIAIGNQLFSYGIRSGSAVALRCTRSLDTCLAVL